jgi:flagellar protein FliO/FliZ
VSAVVLLFKVVLVFGLLAVVLYVLKRTDGLGSRNRNSVLEVRGSTRLGKGAALTVVRVDGKDLLLGVTDHTVTLLTSEDAAVPAELPGVPAKKNVFQRSKNDVSSDAVAAALASLRGETAPASSDGSVDASTRLADRRRVARTDARRDEEHPWTRACRPAFRTADGDDALL